MTIPIGENMRDAIRSIVGNRKEALRILGEEKYRVPFPMCSHPELMPNMWNQPKPEPARTVGSCPIHDYGCPVCGFGVGCDPPCNCAEMRY